MNFCARRPQLEHLLQQTGCHVKAEKRYWCEMNFFVSRPQLEHLLQKTGCHVKAGKRYWCEMNFFVRKPQLEHLRQQTGCHVKAEKRYWCEMNFFVNGLQWKSIKTETLFCASVLQTETTSWLKAFPYRHILCLVCMVLPYSVLFLRYAVVLVIAVAADLHNPPTVASGNLFLSASLFCHSWIRGHCHKRSFHPNQLSLGQACFRIGGDIS